MARKRNPACHLCGQKKDEMASCSIARCSISYCYQCIQHNFNQNFTPEGYISSCWVCYSCTKSCKCSVCLGVLPVRKKNPISKPKTTNPSPNSQKPIETPQNLPKTNKTQQQGPEKLCSLVPQEPEPKVKVQNSLESPSLLVEAQGSRNCSGTHKPSSSSFDSNYLLNPQLAYNPTLNSFCTMFPNSYPPLNFVYFYF